MVNINKIKSKLPEGLRIDSVHKLNGSRYLVVAIEDGGDLFNATDPYYEYNEKTGELSRFDVAGNREAYIKAMQSEDLS